MGDLRGRWRRILLLASGLGLAAGCRPDVGALPPEGRPEPAVSGAADAGLDAHVTAESVAATQDAATRDAAVDGGPPAPPPPLLPPLGELPLIRRLPRGTLLAGAVASPANLDKLLNLRRQLDASGPWGEELDAVGRRLTGQDLADVSRWTQLSIDPDSPVTGALLSTDPVAIAVGWRSTDTERMRVLFYLWAAGRHPLREVSVGDARLLLRHDGQGPVFGWQGDEAWLVFGDGLLPGEALYHAQNLAAPMPTRLSTSLVFPSVVMQGGGDPTAVIFANVPAMVQKGLLTAAEDPKIGELHRSEVANRAMREFERANRDASSRLRLQSLDLLARARAGARTQLLRSAAYPFGPALIEVSLTETALEIRCTQPLSEGSLPSLVLPTTALDGAPLLPPGHATGSLSLRIDPQTTMEWIRGLLVIADIGALALFEAELRATSGADLRRDMIEPSLGELAIVLEPDPAWPVQTPGAAAVLSTLRPAVRWRMADPEGVDRTLTRLSRPFEWLSPAGPRHYAVRLPGLPPLWAEVEDDGLRVGLDSTPEPPEAPPGPAEEPPEAPSILDLAANLGQTPDAGVDAAVTASADASGSSLVDAGPSGATDAAAADAGPDGRADTDGAAPAAPADATPPASPEEPTPAIGLTVAFEPRRLATILVDDTGALPATDARVALGRAIARGWQSARLQAMPRSDAIILTLRLQGAADSLSTTFAEVLTGVVRARAAAPRTGTDSRIEASSATQIAEPGQ